MVPANDAMRMATMVTLRIHLRTLNCRITHCFSYDLHHFPILLRHVEVASQRKWKSNFFLPVVSRM